MHLNFSRYVKITTTNEILSNFELNRILKISKIEVISTLSSCFKEIYLVGSRLDIILVVEKDSRRSIDISKNWPIKQGSTIITRNMLLGNEQDVTNIKLIAIVIGGWNLFIRHTDTPTGLLKNKIEQLKKCGYEIVLVHWKTWPKSTKSQIAYMHTKIFEQLKAN